MGVPLVWYWCAIGVPLAGRGRAMGGPWAMGHVQHMSRLCPRKKLSNSFMQDFFVGQGLDKLWIRIQEDENTADVQSLSAS